MGIKEQIFNEVPETTMVFVDKKRELHGEPATAVTVFLKNNVKVTGTFATESKAGFGGVEFSSNKDIGSLMVAKIQSVLRGTAE